jgi:acetyl-CoA carboxylase biotin carboxyl carrier protein
MKRTPTPTYDIEELKKLMRAFRRFDLTELEVRQGDSAVVLKRTHAGGRVRVEHHDDTTVPFPLPTAGKGEGRFTSVSPDAPDVADEDADATYITSPLVGTFYRAPSPEARTSWRWGARCSEATAVCIIEAMKLMNEIECEVRARSSPRCWSRTASPWSSARRLFRSGRGLTVFKQGAHRQPRRDRAADHPRVQGARPAHRGGALARRRRRAARARADESVCIGPAAPRKSYLHIPSIIAAAEITGADAIHPGYGFLSENAALRRGVPQCQITFIGPTPEAMRRWGDKVTARTHAALRLPLLPGTTVLRDPSTRSKRPGASGSR